MMLEEKEYGAILISCIKTITHILETYTDSKIEQDFSSGENSFRNEILSDKGKNMLDS